MNDFQKDLEYSLDAREDKVFDNFYFRVFNNLSWIETIKDLPRQKEGIDKVLHFKNGKQVLIDEKKRRKDYGDILLEEWSIVESKKKGWTGDPNKKTDYIVYAIMPSSKVYLLPYLLLQSAWRKHYKEWKDTYKTIYARNATYNTSSLCIPVEILLASIKEEIQKQLIDRT